MRPDQVQKDKYQHHCIQVRIMQRLLRSLFGGMALLDNPGPKHKNNIVNKWPAHKNKLVVVNMQGCAQ